MDNALERRLYAIICSHDGIKAKDIAKAANVQRTEINHILYSAPFIHELCYQDSEYNWYGMIRQACPHEGLQDFCGYYAKVGRFLKQSEEDWLDELKTGCRSIGRNLNNTRGLIHSFCDARNVMSSLFADLGRLADRLDENWQEWEICFELRIRRAKYVRIYADVLVITADKVFSLEFKMKDKIDSEEELQAVKYARYLDVIFGDDYEVIPALVLTRASDFYSWEKLPGTTAEIPVCSGDMLFNLLDDYLSFLG